MNNLTHTDAAIIRAVRRGEKNAFAELLERYLDGVYKFAYRYVRNGADAEDIAQDAFVRAWKNLKRFDTKRNFKTWLYAIAKNAALDLLKKKRPLLFSQLGSDDAALDLLSSIPDIAELPDAVLDHIFQRDDLVKMLKHLPETYRTILTMRYHDNLKFREIAAVLREPVDTVKSRHRRGLMLLRNLIGQYPSLSLR